MKLFIALLVAILMIITSIDSFSQTWQSNCNATPTSEMLFRQDINKLLIARLFATNSPYKDSIDLPTMERDSIARAVYAIYNMPNSAVKDTIMTIFGNATFIQYAAGNPATVTDSSHINNRFSTKTLKIETNYSSSWASSWLSGNYTNTPNNIVNDLSKKYFLNVSIDTFLGASLGIEI